MSFWILFQMKWKFLEKKKKFRPHLHLFTSWSVNQWRIWNFIPLLPDILHIFMIYQKFIQSLQLWAKRLFWEIIFQIVLAVMKTFKNFANYFNFASHLLQRNIHLEINFLEFSSYPKNNKYFSNAILQQVFCYHLQFVLCALRLAFLVFKKFD